MVDNSVIVVFDAAVAEWNSGLDTLVCLSGARHKLQH